MIEFVTGNLLESDAEALVNTVNTVGVMGKGIALQFKQLFPNNTKAYLNACKSKEFHVGQLLITEDESLHTGKKIIINFPTKTNWRLPSEYDYIEKGLAVLAQSIKDKNIKSIAIPPLGAGNGGLDWNKVKQLLVQYLNGLDCQIQVYEPNQAVKEVLRKERVKLTPARAMLLAVLYDMVKSGEFVSEFASEKTAYFLQRLGGQNEFKLQFSENFYGPYSGKVKHVLYYLNGSYIMGYSSKDKKPFEELDLVQDGEDDVLNYLRLPENAAYYQTVQKTQNFLNKFYSSFGLELLSTVDFIMQKNNTTSDEVIKKELWSDRKRTMFSNEKYLKIAIQHLQTHLN